MKILLCLFFGFVALGSVAWAEVAPVTVSVPEAKAWIGQRVPFYIELRAKGSFTGTANFDLPQLPGVLLMKVGNPVVGSQQIEDESWFIQTHEFALFSQRPGSLEVPSFSVRFASSGGFTGPAKDVPAQTTGWKVEIQRPPGGDNIGFLITTETLDVTEKWEPLPGRTQVGAIFKRSIVQRAPQLSGMALAPAPTTAPDGIRVYTGDAQIKDQFERGDFFGERSETITYLLTKPGTLVLPELTYVWWNPQIQRLQSKTLPAVTFEVTPAREEQIVARNLWLLVLTLPIGLGAWQRRRLAAWGRRCWRTLNPPDRVAARKLLRACRMNNAPAAEAAWMAWRNLQNAAFQPGPELRSAVLELQRHLFGLEPTSMWQGAMLARAFRKNFAGVTAHSTRVSASALPLLNPKT